MVCVLVPVVLDAPVFDAEGIVVSGTTNEGRGADVGLAIFIVLSQIATMVTTQKDFKVAVSQ